MLCLDERPCFLIGDVVEPIAMQSGQIRKEHYAYTKEGSCALLAAIEPLIGNRLVQVHHHRTKKEFTQFFQAMAAANLETIKIQLVLDNLNTHDSSAFYENLLAYEAFSLTKRFEFFFTPKSASWLNMIEIEFSALSRLCLQRRIPTREMLEAELMALIAERTQKRIQIYWQFSIEVCRQKLNSRYSIVNVANSKFTEVPII